ncbi:acyl--CoA ligase [Brachyspira hyodysenteriae]|uniref:AMP-binding enzyme n=3 Tax=Brachyspira hyodysenteriae TaxID=159 RepID=A0A3B6V8A0_BRAHW|nr:class I adenylate-forming enzyme family protein [Brachyspira hyodysenteriae]ACN82786.1 AMP-binding enzyme [Brachyspira hyodysenteriae WA1]ANN62590.1 AMP-binding protein [Brachyspira hyodysenteriae ATCC 27164]AUJ48536.1 AMP-binding protein [Brachyspira hyodysenteriae]KLI15386.1 AMP-binding protein [Brachyspira hyodysenteriae]KLI28910.1 AMP-binding protein [Brachyspira hyodysenteriae]
MRKLSNTNFYSLKDSEDIFLIHKENKNFIKYKEFVSDIVKSLEYISKFEEDTITVFIENAYRFIVIITAGFILKKRVNVLNNNSPKYVESIIDNTMVYISDTENSALNLDEVFESSCNDKWFDVLKETIIDENVYVNFYTSGSTGYPKLIEKTLKQFEAEATKIVNQFTENIKDSLFLYTVPHYHSYGFVFAVLVPFMLEAKCINNRINYLETVNNFADYEKITIVTTPAFLKRIDKSSLKIKSNWYLFSSTGMLEEKVNDLCKEIFGTDVTEIYGSTEAGAMAYRRRSENQLWTRLSVVKLKVDENGSIECCSGYTGENVWIHVGDVVNMKNEDEFELLGREDSIVKIEGKRISVQQIDRQILMDKHFKDSYTIYCKSDKREYIVSFIVMNNKNRNSEDMKKYVIDYLKGYFETVVLPKKIYFVDSIPRSEIGKIDRKALDAIMEGN